MVLPERVAGPLRPLPERVAGPLRPLPERLAGPVMLRQPAGGVTSTSNCRRSANGLRTSPAEPSQFV